MDINVKSPSIDIDVTPASDPIDINVSKEGGGSGNYNALTNKPQIEGRVLEGDKSFKQLGMEPATVQEVEAILYLE